MNFAIHTLIGFAKIGAALRVTDDDILAKFLDHTRRDLAGERAFFLPVHVLRAETDAQSLPASQLTAGIANEWRT